MAIQSPPDKAGQLANLYTRLSLKTDSSDAAVVSDMFDDAIQMCLDYTRGKLSMPVLIQAKKLAIIMYNEQGTEGETSRSEGGVSQSFEVGMPSAIKTALSPYRVARTRRFS
ncbi:hypothetical protein DA799_14090 [Lactiplantibacillus plantarum]|uniref:phage head-tail connector protein n=1 Tax=Lactiplantibacillus plantarum TaxID=1590 RepID=UPI0009783EF6|nr:phage head-tail connector protein [Lactiplantibacillus plantarum]MBO2713214.1 hypothetical protein [Lactiplantibacillus plantarum]PKX67087.1 hypothetical protein CUB88_01805 [Lactiplantibacillus plantarum]PTM28940.1 hypothetical protein DA799_14090 [Lactiplantibacillus plantarum]